MKYFEYLLSPSLPEKFKTEKPFPWVVIDGALQRNYAVVASQEFPKENQIRWFKYSNLFEQKLAMDKWELFPPTIARIIEEMNGAEFLRFLEWLTGLKGLIPDPHLNGGGLHLTEPGGFLNVHEDYNYHPVTKLRRVLNVILFLNDYWVGDWGGDLEFWDYEMKEKAVSIAPIFNRMAVFLTDKANHGHPDPLKTPQGINRRSIAVYYYVNDPDYKEPAHSVLFKRRPQDPEDTPEIAELRRKRGIRRLKDETK